MAEQMKNCICSMSFVLFKNLESGNYFIFKPGDKKHLCLRKQELYLVKIFKDRAIQCKNLQEVSKASKPFLEIFREEFPELYI